MKTKILSARGGFRFAQFTGLFLALAFCIVRNTNAQPGSLDSTFSSDGIVTTDFGSGGNYGKSVALQTDGKIVVAGYSYNIFTSNDDFALVRYNSDGTLDNTFGSLSNGIVVTDFAGYNDIGNSVAIQSDGKILVAGYSNNGSMNVFAVARYNPDGTLDNTFDGDGKVTTINMGFGDEGHSVAIQSDGKIVVAGFSSNGATNDFALVRYNTDGSLDNSFSADGRVNTDFASTWDEGYSVRLQADGKIVVGGSSGTFLVNLALARYNTDGTLDNTFDIDGKVTTTMGGVFTTKFSSVAIQTDGKIVTTGWIDMNVWNDFALFRYNTDGSLDDTFDGDGKVTNSTISEGYSVRLQIDGKIVAASVDHLTRYNSDGSLDSSFNANGIVFMDINGYSTAIQSDGKIVVAGDDWNGSDADFAVARYNGDAVGGISDITEQSTGIKIYPNPFTSSATLSISHPELVSGSQEMLKQVQHDVVFVMYDLLGKKVYSQSIRNSDSFVIRRNNLPSGMYFYKVTDREKILGTGKIVIQ